MPIPNRRRLRATNSQSELAAQLRCQRLDILEHSFRLHQRAALVCQRARHDPCSSQEWRAECGSRLAEANRDLQEAVQAAQLDHSPHVVAALLAGLASMPARAMPV